MSRILESDATETEKSWENALRPSRFEEFPGQTEVKEKLKVFPVDTPIPPNSEL